MTVNVLGISAYYHDSACAVVVDGTIAAAVTEDKFSLVKHDTSFPARAAEYCLQAAGIEAADLDAIVFYERPAHKFLRTLRWLFAAYPAGLRPFMQTMIGWLSDKLWTRLQISRTLDVDPRLIRFVEHHASHAACAFFSSPFDTAAVLTVDGVGERSCGTIYDASRDSGLRLLKSTPYPNSVGLVYAALTAFLGFRPNDSECSTMALSAFAQADGRDLIAPLLSYDEEGTPQVDVRMFDFTAVGSGVFRKALTDKLGEPLCDVAESFSAIDGNAMNGADARSRFAAQLASGVQRQTEEIVLAQAQHAHGLTGRDELCFAGGVAANAAAVRALIETAGFDRVFVPPDPGDAGGAVGAAFLGSVEMGVTPNRQPVRQIYSGPTMNGAGLREVLPFIKLDSSPGHAGDAARDSDGGSIVVCETESVDELVERVARAIAGGAIVGWAQGPAEFGPRALGARSLLCDPAKIDVARRMSQYVKHRAEFRPYALSVAEEDADRVLDGDWRQPPYEWMQATIPVQASAIPRVRAAMHIDGTTRPQVCARSQHPVFHALLQAYGKMTGLAALLNTSLNEPGLPLICSAEQALLYFARSDMDLLAIDNLLLQKHGRGERQ